MDKIHAMQLFIRVAELESFSRAADTLGLPKGSVSRQIQGLENLLGTQLSHPLPYLPEDNMQDLIDNLRRIVGAANVFTHDDPEADLGAWHCRPPCFSKASTPDNGWPISAPAPTTGKRSAWPTIRPSPSAAPERQPQNRPMAEQVGPVSLCLKASAGEPIAE